MKEARGESNRDPNTPSPQPLGGPEGKGSFNIDIRSDIYSLGVILYELLCGRLPYDLSTSSIPHATRIIQETDPPRPSTIIRTVRRDVEAIVLKALEKEREKRYQSAAELAADLRRHLRGEPVEAKPPSRWMRAVKWVGRHPILSTCLVCLAIATSTASLTWYANWHLNQRPYDIVKAEDGREVRLVTMANVTIATWRTPVEKGIRVAVFVPAGESKRASTFVLIGYSDDPMNRFPGELCLYSDRHGWEEPLWRRQIEEEDTPSRFQKDRLSIHGFSVQLLSVMDIFAGPEHEGPEIAVAWLHISSESAIRVYDLDGNLLYQDWHDGGPCQWYWSGAYRLLIVAAWNTECLWPERGHDVLLPRIHPEVLFALQPESGHIGRTYVSPWSPDSMPTLRWYRCVPPQYNGILDNHALLTPPLRRTKTSGVVTLTEMLLNAENCGVSWQIDADGYVVGPPHLQNAFEALKSKPFNPDEFQLIKLPPCQKKTDGSSDER